MKKTSQACKEALNETGITGEVIEVKNYEEILDVDGLIIPGGESTVISTNDVTKSIQLGKTKAKN